MGLGPVRCGARSTARQLYFPSMQAPLADRVDVSFGLAVHAGADPPTAASWATGTPDSLHL